MHFSYGQPAKEQAFKKTVYKVITALSRRDAAGLSNYIDKKTAVYLLYRIGMRDSYAHFTTLGFSDTTYPNAPFYDNVKRTGLTHAELPSFNCEKWTKTGMFVDTAKTDHLLSNTAKWLNNNFQEHISQKTIKGFLELESRSRRIVVADNNGNELIFYLRYRGQKWQLTVIDKLTCDCSA